MLVIGVQVQGLLHGDTINDELVTSSVKKSGMGGKGNHGNNAVMGNVGKEEGLKTCLWAHLQRQGTATKQCLVKISSHVFGLQVS